MFGSLEAAPSISKSMLYRAIALRVSPKMNLSHLGKNENVWLTRSGPFDFKIFEAVLVEGGVTDD